MELYIVRELLWLLVGRRKGSLRSEELQFLYILDAYAVLDLILDRVIASTFFVEQRLYIHTLAVYLP